MKIDLQKRIKIQIFLLAVVICFSSCTYFSLKNTPTPSPSQLNSINKTPENSYFTGRISLRRPESNHNGEMSLKLYKNSELKLSIYTPLIGSLIYELRANLKKLLILNFDEMNYILANNTRDTRQTWLGMDISINELKWLIFGVIPKNIPIWQKENISKNKFQLSSKNTKIIIKFNSYNKIEWMEKYIYGFLEYRANIPTYQKLVGQYFPRKISIKDSSVLNQWLILVSEIQIPQKTFKPLNLIPPLKMHPLKN